MVSSLKGGFFASLALVVLNTPLMGLSAALAGAAFWGAGFFGAAFFDAAFLMLGFLVGMVATVESFPELKRAERTHELQANIAYVAILFKPDVWQRCAFLTSTSVPLDGHPAFPFDP
jgi:hypothetical protein